MTAKILIAAQDLASGFAKGDIVSVLPDDAEFGNKETLPNFIRLTVSDATKAQADAYLQQWGKVFTYTILQQNPQWYRVRIEVDPAAVSAGGAGAEVKQKLKDFILRGLGPTLNWTVTLIAQTQNSIDVEIDKPADLQAGRAQLDDKFSEVISTTRYYFSGAHVDAAIAAGGEFTRTKEQINAIIRDKLED